MAEVGSDVGLSATGDGMAVAAALGGEDLLAFDQRLPRYRVAIIRRCRRKRAAGDEDGDERGAEHSASGAGELCSFRTWRAPRA